MDNLSLILPLVGLELMLKLIALLDLRRRTNSEVKGARRWVWALAILFITTIGSVVYLTWGRRDSDL